MKTRLAIRFLVSRIHLASTSILRALLQLDHRASTLRQPARYSSVFRYSLPPFIDSLLQNSHVFLLFRGITLLSRVIIASCSDAGNRRGCRGREKKRSSSASLDPTFRQSFANFSFGPLFRRQHLRSGTINRLMHRLVSHARTIDSEILRGKSCSRGSLGSSYRSSPNSSVLASTGFRKEWPRK